MTKLSVIIITLNEEHNIERCIKAVQPISDEILVVDSLSTDRTVEVSEKLGAKVISQEFLGYVAQRNFATEHAAHDLVLMLDADEVVSSILQKSVLAVKNDKKSDIYQLSRMTNYCGRWIKHSGWYPDRKIRLYNRTKGKWAGELVHEYWEPYHKNETVEVLNGDLEHYSFRSINEHIIQIQKFSVLNARSAVKKGKTCSLIKLWLGPKWFFFSRYFLKLGFLDGYYGYIVCKLSAYALLIKYSLIREYGKKGS